MTTRGEEAVAIARRWCGTPYRHQAACEGAGTDCLGLLRGVWRELYGREPETVPHYTSDWAETRGDEVLWAAARRHLVEVARDDEASGDVLLFRMRDGSIAKHLGIQARIGVPASFVHAFAGHGVTESPLSRPWRRRIVARFRLPSEAV